MLYFAIFLGILLGFALIGFLWEQVENKEGTFYSLIKGVIKLIGICLILAFFLTFLALRSEIDDPSIFTEPIRR
ncbi:hypothetical protein FXF61_06325 [Pseudomonas sp. C27(2019)]|uniref:hypothetical protein n=1 Tax=Pseudomonas sp. C27(2019) TaxID=2604941 RepID=UPI0012489871|nr:hypothetical protein [Pseudomonas sp. C27(2019)]QEY58810.1 hypothetical protein FXF61_06325 [Pseudomonas sp. C27(2019)]